MTAQGVQLDTTEALNLFLADVERRALRMAQIAVSNLDDALDLAQDAMLDFVRRYATRPEGEWKPLFYRILQSRITDWHRRNTVRNRLRSWFGGAGGGDENDGDQLENVADSRGDTPAELLLRRDLASALEKAVKSLPLRQQQAFLLRAWEGLDVAETACAMGCSQGSVKTHYSRAVHTMQGLLGKYRS